MPAAPAKDPLSGRVGHLSPEQQTALDTFRQELKDGGAFVPERHDDPTLLRFLRARKFDVAKAKAMILSQEEWRKEIGADELYKPGFEFPEKKAVDEIYPQYYHKTDKDGRPVYIEKLGKIDVEKLNKITSPDRLIKRLVSEYELFINDRLPAATIKKGGPEQIETSCTILDLKGVGIMQFYKVKDLVSKASSIGQDRYPECMGKFFIVNAPWGFTTVWGIVKQWLDEVTVNKITICGSSYKKDLLAQIPAENLPEDLGGSCKCEGGCSLADQGPWQDAEIMKKVEEKKAARAEEIKTSS